MTNECYVIWSIRLMIIPREGIKWSFYWFWLISNENRFKNTSNSTSLPRTFCGKENLFPIDTSLLKQIQYIRAQDHCLLFLKTLQIPSSLDDWLSIADRCYLRKFSLVKFPVITFQINNFEASAMIWLLSKIMCFWVKIHRLLDEKANW